jgi:hypothetical protein
MKNDYEELLASVCYREAAKIKFTLGPDMILRTECLPNTIMDLDDALESTRISWEMVNHVERPLLCDLTYVIKMSQECRRHFSGADHAKTFNKCALIVTSPISKLIGNFFLGLNRPIKPTRLFNSKEEGLKWLKES